MKKLITLIFYCLPFALYAQINISGIVYDIDNNPLEGASVYINNTSIGTSTNNNGEFEFSIKEGTYILVISYIGYISEEYKLDTKNIVKPIIVNLLQGNNVLDEVVILKGESISDAKRASYIKSFRENFIGESTLAERCIIKNEYVLEFEFDSETDILLVSTSGPLIIENTELGYIIIYDLVHFELNYTKVSYLGYLKYQKMKGTEKEERVWKENRKLAYLGSLRHFIKTGFSDNQPAGFAIDEYERVPNPKRPPIKEIVKAIKFLTKRSKAQKNPYGNDVQLEVEIASAKEVLKKSKLKKYIDVIKKRGLSFNDFFKKGKNPHLFSENSLMIRYTREFEGNNYPSLYLGKNYQTSKIYFRKREVPLTMAGILEDPLDVVLEGYWAFEKVGDALPLDYSPD